MLSRPFGRQSFERICNRLRRRAPVQEIRPRGRAFRVQRLWVLLAEDNEPNQRVAKAILRGAGYTIDVARTGTRSSSSSGRSL